MLARLKKISPVAWQHIHFQGHFIFSGDKIIDLDEIINKVFLHGVKKKIMSKNCPEISTVSGQNPNKHWGFLHFDSIGVPSVEEMIKEYDSPSGWQEAMTYKWIDALIHQYDFDYLFFEGQVNLKFIYDGFALHNFTDYKIILVDCSEEEMAYRLTHNRRII